MFIIYLMNMQPFWINHILFYRLKNLDKIC